MTTAHNQEQKRARLLRQFYVYSTKVSDHELRRTPAERRAFTLAVRCLRTTLTDLVAIDPPKP